MILKNIYSYFFSKKYCLFIILLSIIFFYSNAKITIGNYPTCKILNNGKYLVISSTNITTTDSSFTSIINNMNFNSTIYNTLDDIYSTTIAQFSKEDNGYIIAIIKNDLYIFTDNGKYIKNVEDISFIEINQIYNIIPFGHLEKEYYFYIIYSNETTDYNTYNKLIFIKCIFNSLLNTIDFEDSISYSIKVNGNLFSFYSFSCKLMKYNNNKVINCIYGDYNNFISTVFDVNSNINNITEIQTNISNIGGQYFNMEVLPDEKEVSVLCSFRPGGYFHCLIYNITDNSFKNDSLITDSGCSTLLTSLIIEYFYETEEILIGCYGNSLDMYINTFSKKSGFGTSQKIEKAINKDSGQISKGSFILSSNQNKYSIFTVIDEVLYLENIDGLNVEIINPQTDEITSSIICNNNYYYNYQKTECINYIPDGYYCNNTEPRTIDKCHNNCKTCNKGPTTNNNNCLSCKDSDAIYFDLGNCTSNCNFGYYNVNNVNYCKCSFDIKCNNCTYESYTNDLCISCNMEDGYYPKKNDPNNIDTYINCYNKSTISEGYFLNYTSNRYEPCYSTCKNCSEYGNDIDHKCIECKSEYEFKNDFENNSNCYQKCVYNYFYDSNNIYQCTSNNSCPEDYSKLISLKKRCIDDCSKDNIYKFEYNNECLEQCPSETHTTTDNLYKCEDNLNCHLKNLYYNYEQTSCIDFIPDGFYYNNNTLKTLDKCHDNCNTCNTGPTSDNNNCLTCKNTGTIYFDLGNCRSNCSNGFFIEESIKKCKCTNNISCYFCNYESIQNNQCVSCNFEDGYYPKSNDNNNIYPFFNCYKNLEGYYLNNQTYEPCFSTCKYCSGFGNEINNKCIECISTHEFKNDFENDNNCYQKCKYNYYYDSNNTYQCTSEDYCPTNYNKLIVAKTRCIEDCKNDNIYKFEYNNYCYEKCPSGTLPSSNNTYLCDTVKIIEENSEECKLDHKELNFYKKEISINDINILTEEYVNQFGFSNNFVSKYDNFFYSIYTYKNITCLKTTIEKAPQIDFGECYEKIKKNYNINDDLIITIIVIKSDKQDSKSSTKYTFSNPETGKVLLNISEICDDDIIIIQEDLISLIEVLDDKKEEYIIKLTSQGIDVFNISDEFYNDLCYHFESPNGKDVPMKDRIASFFPNITLCDRGCEIKGVDLETMKVKCTCTFNDLINNELMDNVYGQSISEIISVVSSFNINVVKCIKDLFNKDNFVKCIGGFIILGLLFGKIICIFTFIFKGFYYIRKFVFSLTESFLRYSQQKIIKNQPPIKKRNIDNKNNKGIKNENNPKIFKKIKINSAKNIRIFENNANNSLVKFIQFNKNKVVRKNKKHNTIKHDIFNLRSLITKKDNNVNDKNEKINIKSIKEYLSPPLDETDFDDILNKDKRTFCIFFCEKFKKNQIFINAFCINEIMRPRSLKLLMIIMTFELYFVINALFYNEEYLSKLFNSTEKETFFSFIPRRFNQFVYTSVVSKIISYLMGYFFIDKDKLKRIFKKNKEDNIKLNYELSKLVKDIKNRFIGLILMTIFLSLICFIYISCFNIVYPCIRIEWIKSSLFILILMQFLNFLFTFYISCLRFIAIKYNSSKIYKLYLWLD